MNVPGGIYALVTWVGANCGQDMIIEKQITIHYHHSILHLTIHGFHGAVSIFLGVEMHKSIISDLLDSFNSRMSRKRFFNLNLSSGQHQISYIEHLHL